jgi:acyl dehydratase
VPTVTAATRGTVEPRLPPDTGARPAREAPLDAVPALTGTYLRVLAAATRAAALRRPPRPGALPTLAYTAPTRADDGSRLTSFQRLVGTPATDTLPAGFVHVLAFPLTVALMARADFPLPVLGMVHVGNRVVQARPLRLGEALTVRAWARDLRPHRRGTQVDLVTEVGAVGEAAVWRGVSTHLARGVRLPDEEPAGPKVEEPAGPKVEEPDGGGVARGHAATHGRATARWDLPGDVGRRYATVSGDCNPLHLTVLTARALGYRRAIAHGMYLASRALAAVDPGQGPAFAWDVEFGAPTLLPGRVDVSVVPVPDGWAYEAWTPGSGRHHLTGRVCPLT